MVNVTGTDPSGREATSSIGRWSVYCMIRASNASTIPTSSAWVR